LLAAFSFTSGPDSLALILTGPRGCEAALTFLPVGAMLSALGGPVRGSLSGARHAYNVAGNIAAAFGRFLHIAQYLVGGGVVSRSATTTTNLNNSRNH
jgi:hypothetical protein